MPDALEVSWDDYRFFDEVARAGSIRAAARVLGVDHATVSRRLANLESSFQVKLLVRGSDGVRLTEAGDELHRAAASVRAELLSVQRKITGADVPLSGRIRVSTHAVLATRFLVPGIAEFRRAHPNIDIDLDLSPQVVSLAMNQADVAIRVTTDPADDTIARRISGFGYAVYAAHDYLSSHDPHAAPGECQWVGWDERGPYPCALRDEHFSAVPVHGRFPAIPAQLEATACGMGLAALPCFMGDSDSRLCRLTDAYEATAVYVLRHPDHRSTVRVRAFYDHIRAFIGGQAPQLEGRAA
ncbi:MAG: LysR family transcriptional regulator [Nannocystaceae bacterium]|nr:LysR family transcriptional regulator [Nannocystaceae bacterium]